MVSADGHVASVGAKVNREKKQLALGTAQVE